MGIRSVTIHEHTVVKTGNPIHMRIEAKKTMRAYEIAHSSGLFRVPRVIDYDAPKGILVLERILNIDHLSSAFTSRYQCMYLVDMIAKSLAVIHNELQLPDDMRIVLPEDLASPDNDVFFHGDMSIKNICVTKDKPGIVILDWQMSLLHGGNATYGTRYFDVVWFVNNLFSFMCRLDQAHRHFRTVIPVATRFISAYFKAVDSTEDYEMFFSYMKRFFEFKLDQRKREDDWKNKLLRIFVELSIKRFINNPELAQLLSSESK